MPDPEVMEQFKTIPASNTCDVMGRNAAMNPRIHLVSSPKAQMMVGPALTVKARGGDNLALHAALNIAEAGDVVVVSNEEDNTRSLIGEIMMAYLRHDRKVAGIVIDGPIRDIDEIGQWDFPVYATGTTPGGPYKEGPGEVNVPVACGGISVNPGDIILGDPDGVIVIPRKDAAQILEDAKKFQEADEKKLEAAKNGTANRAWVEKTLAAKEFKVIIVEDVKLELKGTEEIFRHEIPDAEVIGTAMTEQEFWGLMETGVPDLVLLDLGLGGSTTIGVEICRNIFKRYPGVHVLIFTGEILNEKLWVDVLDAGADGIILKTGELLTKTDVQAVMDGKKLVFNYPILEKIVERFKTSVRNDAKRQEAVISYDIDEYDERFLRHLALGYTKEMIANLKGMPFGVKSLEKRQNDLIGRLFGDYERVGVNATRLVVRALELRILDIDNLEADEE